MLAERQVSADSEGVRREAESEGSRRQVSDGRETPKCWSDEQEPDMRQRSGVSRPIDVKPDTCTERYEVNPADISMKVTRITLGDLSPCHVLPAS